MFKTAEDVREVYAKVAGVELNLHGYSREPNVVNSPEDEDAMEQLARRWDSEVGTPPRPEDFTQRAPGLRGVFGATVPDSNALMSAREEHNKRHAEWVAANPPPAGYVDPFEYSRGSRTQTQHGHMTSGKLTAMLLGSSHLPTTDLSYSETPQEHRLSRADLKAVVEHYRKAAAVSGNDPVFDDAHEHFLAHAEELANHPDLKFARLEWE